MLMAYIFPLYIILFGGCLLPLHAEHNQLSPQYGPESSSYLTSQYAHPSVVANAEKEAQLPPKLSKSHRFLSDPRIAAALAKDSWFTEHEMPVYQREAEKIPREMIYKILKQSGLEF